MTQQLEMFDKPISEIRAVQLVDEKEEQNFGIHFEFRFYGEQAWHPVNLVKFIIPSAKPETNSESTETSSESDESAAGN